MAQAYRNRPRVKTWAKVAGPVSAIRKTAKRLGWQTLGPFRLRNDVGIDFYLDKTSPKLLKWQIERTREEPSKEGGT